MAISSGFQRLMSIIEKYPSIRLFEPINPTPTTADAAKECGHSMEEIIKTVILCGKDKSGKNKQYFAVILRGSDQIDQNLVRKIVECKRISFASSEETLDVSGFPGGGVPPIGLNEGLKIFVEQSVLNTETVIGGGGDHKKLIEIDPKLILEVNGISETYSFMKV